MTAFEFSDFQQTAGKVVDALLAMGKAVDASGLEKPLTELVKLRVSQINACTFCLQYHLNLARQAGIPAAKLDLLAAWRDAPIFDQRERAALGWAEALTGMAGQPIQESTRQHAAAAFSPTELAFLTAAIASINAWNRIGGGLGFAPPPAAG
ncbi:carboxymuconolactone decarboxylase family protein [Zoogloea dura]|jgi:AhpD family alkylhydroperoxidase|uniref:Carboxymuconolactone decarboxylase family protein n=1 Tax=Zoogloea dura TaxID=2728840 RepID=A0A848G693_9RHOO|nr:carboxymuconolactone decarboxylase family protein [Zoogloea dura]NML25161.1 carboxymuconolactone decarboxylase family protein [Zoogloea dura]